MYPTNQPTLFRSILAVTAFLFVLLGYHASAHAASSVTLAWDASDPGVAGYNVYYGTGSGDYTQVVDAGNQASATISNLSDGSTYYFAVTAYDPNGLESLPSGEVSYTPTGNQPPVAVDDSAVTDEGKPVTISVLSNDSDPDNGPSALTIQSVGGAANGTTSVAGNGVTYSPAPGFYGVDSFSYTISDGDLSASATVTVTVQSSAISDNLVSAGLTGRNIGTGTGGSRELIDQSWEVNGSGVGVLDLADSLYLESSSISGNFQACVRIHSLESEGAAPEVGLMVREGTAPDARFATITATTDDYSYASRTIAGGSVTKTPLARSADYPDVWVLIQRTGDIIEFATSNDGINFNSAGSTVLASLTANVEVGIGVWSGTQGVDARAVVTDYAVVPTADADIEGTGLTGRYYAGTNFETLVLTRIENINFDWGTASPGPNVPDDFSVRWSGKIEPRYSQDYTFYGLVKGGIRLWVNGKLIIDAWTGNSGKEELGTIRLEAGQRYDIVMEYVEVRGQASAILSWSSPSQPKEVIPVDALYPEVQ